LGKFSITACRRDADTGHVSAKYGKQVECDDTRGALHVLLGMEDPDNAKDFKDYEKEGVYGRTDCQGVMWGFNPGGKIAGQEGLEIHIVGVDLDEGDPDETGEWRIKPMAWYRDHCPWRGFVHESRNSTKERPRYHLFVEPDRPIRSKREFVACIHAINDAIGGGVHLSAKNLNRRWNAMRKSADFAMFGDPYDDDNERPKLNVDAVVAASAAQTQQRASDAENATVGGSESPTGPSEPPGDAEQKAMQQTLSRQLVQTERNILRIPQGERHDMLCSYLTAYAGFVAGMIRQGYVGSLEEEKQKLLPVLEQLLDSYDETGEEQESRRRDTMRVLDDSFEFGGERPRDIDPSRFLLETMSEVTPAEDNYPDFPTDALPASLRRVAESIAKRNQVSIEMAAHNILGAATIAVQHLADVDSVEFKTVICNDFLTLARSGERKSVVYKYFADVIEGYQRDLRDAVGASEADYEFEREAYDVAIKKLRSNKEGLNPRQLAERRHALGSAPTAPTSGNIIVKDSTMEAVASMLERSPVGTCWLLDEAATVLEGFMMSQEKAMTSASILNNLWDGAPLEIRRVTRETKPIYDRRMSILWSIQPETANRFINDARMKTIGLLPRFLAVVPRSMSGFRDVRFAQRHPEVIEVANEVIRQFQQKMLERISIPPNLDERGRLEMMVLTFDADAEAAYFDAQEELEPMKRIGGKYHEIHAFADKLLTHAARIAAVLTLWENPKATTVSLKHYQAGVMLAHYYAEVWIMLHKEMISCDSEWHDYERFKTWLMKQKKDDINHAIVSTNSPIRGRMARQLRSRLYEEAVRDGILIPIPLAEQKNDSKGMKLTHRINRAF